MDLIMLLFLSMKNTGDNAVCHNQRTNFELDVNYVVNVDDLNVRSRPSIDARIVDELEEGDIFYADFERTCSKYVNSRLVRTTHWFGNESGWAPSQYMDEPNLD